MKFLPSLSPLALVSLAVVLSSCANPANRRELYNSTLADSGPWHDYERRRTAEEVTGVSAGSAPTVVPGARGAKQPPSSPLPPGTTAAPATPAQVTESSSTGAPPTPVAPPSPVAAPDAVALPAATPAVPDAAPTPAAP